MPCDTARLPNQTLSQRKQEVLDSVVRLNALLVSGKVKPKIGPQGAVVFEGWTEQDRSRVTDACAYRRLMAIGSSLAKAKLAQAETLAGRKVNMQALGAGVHFHSDGKGGGVWHEHKG